MHCKHFCKIVPFFVHKYNNIISCYNTRIIRVDPSNTVIRWRKTQYPLVKSAATKILISTVTRAHSTTPIYLLCINVNHPALYVARHYIVVGTRCSCRERVGVLARSSSGPRTRRGTGEQENTSGHSRGKTLRLRLAQQSNVTRCIATAAVPLAYPYYLRWPTAVPLLSAAGVLAGDPGAFRGPASFAAADKSSRMAWRTVRRLLVARLTAGTPSSGRCSLNCHPRDYTVAYLVGRVSTSVATGLRHDSLSRHCPHAHLPRRRANIAAS